MSGIGDEDSGPEGNRRLTALVGALLLVLFAAQGVTILFLDQLLTWHFVIGLALIGPVALKVAVTGYRFVRYYAGAAAYRRQGPPATPLRVLAPLVVLLTVAVLATGCTLALGGRDAFGLPVLFLHKAFFWCWAAVTGVHVLAYVWRLPRLIAADLPRRRAARRAAAPVGGGGRRWAVLAVGLAAGAALALYGPSLAGRWDVGQPQHVARPHDGHRHAPGPGGPGF
ncbi:hypothetical protein PUR71_09725 [Streptomyces sp. SP17BM10]|uniref:hypothetical protein n=1 Tax=Streptomyces sp. SP17BM10 TaxID=3002530 RepID=UPI002E775208|nr:hypothetical protein [Streptomyces sp. SP17BM10]MEE1783193.1 hypothetical protein [Streptomyces sp. SP17BM10]